MSGKSSGVGARIKFREVVDPDEPYIMNLPDLGHAVIINNIASEMPGSNEDVKALKQSCQTVGFEVQVHENCTAQEMRTIKRWIIDKENHIDCNTFLLAIICHGNKQGHLLDKHKSYGWNTEDFVGDLSVVESLLGKPKIVIIQSCRGGQWSKGKPIPPGTLTDDEDMAAPHIVADKADLFLAYATVPGYRAYGGDEDGSVYLQAFAAFLQDHYMKRPLDRIYLMVKRAMIDSEQGEQGMVHASEERNSLTKVLHFGEYRKENATKSQVLSKVEGDTEHFKTQLRKKEQKQKKELEEKMAEMKTVSTGATRKPSEESKTESTSPTVMPRNVTDASKVKWKVTDTVVTRLDSDYVSGMCVTYEGAVVIWGREEGDKILKQFDMKTNTEIISQNLKDEPYGITMLTLGGKPALAISNGLRHMIEFRSLSDLSQIIQNFSTGSFEPAALCSRSSTTLLFVNRSEIPRCICEIDCRGAAPILLRKKIWTEMLHVADMCIVPYESKPLLVASDLEYGSVTAYNLLSNELEWSIQTHVSSITTDGRDYILGVGGDGIMMFSLLNNKNLGVLIRHGDKGLGKIKLVDWCNKTASLLVAHGVNKKINLSTIQFECQYS